MNEIISKDFILSEIRTDSDIREVIEKLQTLKSLLEAANQFHEYAGRYAQLEVQTYLRIIDLGMVDKVPAKNYLRQCVKWLSGLQDYEVVELVKICGAEGITLHAYWKREVKQKELSEKYISHMKERGELAKYIFKQDGYVDLNSVFENCRKVDKEILSAYKDSIRADIRKMGGNGLGEGTNIYYHRNIQKVKPEVAKRVLAEKQRNIEEVIERLTKDFQELGVFGGEPEQQFIEITTKTVSGSDITLSDGIKLGFAMGLPNTFLKVNRPGGGSSDYLKAKVLAQACKNAGMSWKEIGEEIDRETNYTNQKANMELLGVS